MIMDQELYSSLYQLRERLRIKSARDGRRLQICSDETLSDIVRLKPETKEEFLNINGIGKTFVERYGDEFLNILNVFYNKNKSSDIMTDDVRQTLKNLENKLVNISAKNRLLYLGKLNSKVAYDLVDYEELELLENIKDLLSGKSKKIKLCDISPKSDDIEKNFRKFKKTKDPCHTSFK